MTAILYILGQTLDKVRHLTFVLYLLGQTLDQLYCAYWVRHLTNVPFILGQTFDNCTMYTRSDT